MKAAAKPQGEAEGKKKQDSELLKVLSELARSADRDVIYDDKGRVVGVRRKQGDARK